MEGEPKRQVNFALVAVAIVAVGLLVVMHADPAQTLTGMLIGVFVIIVIVNGGKKRLLQNRLGPEIQAEIDQGKPYLVRMPVTAINMLKEGRKIEAIKLCREATGLGLMEAKNQIDELHLRLEMGQSIQCVND